MFRQRGDRSVRSFIGGSFLGTLPGQLPGAFTGGAIGLIYSIETLPKAETNEAELKL